MRIPIRVESLLLLEINASVVAGIQTQDVPIERVHGELKSKVSSLTILTIIRHVSFKVDGDVRGLFKKYREFWISAGYAYSIFDFLWRYFGTQIPHLCR